MVDYFRDKTISRRQGSLYGDGSFAILPGSDGHILMSLVNNRETLAELMAAEGVTEDRGATGGDPMAPALERWTGTHKKEELFALGQAMRFPWAPISTIDEVVESPQLAARRFVRVPVAPGKGSVFLPGLPYKFRSFTPPPPKAAPRPGQHNRQILDGSFLGRRKEGNRRFGETLEDAGKPVLEGVRVLDFTWMLAGPYATRTLADFGAEVIKVESPRATPGEESDAAYRAAWNRNKRSIALDLDRPEAREIASRLASTADVVVESFSPRVMAHWGFSYDDLRKIKPDLVMASISAMGQTGPWRDYVGFGPTFHALSGLISKTSQGLPFPVCPSHAYGDTIVGLYAALAILAALLRRDANGRGEYIDLSGFEALCTLVGPALVRAAGNPGADEEKQDWEPEKKDRVGFYPCMGEDRWCAVAFPGQSDWEALRGVIGLPGLADEKFSSPDGRETHREELGTLIASWTAGYTPEQVVDMLQRAGVAAGVVQDARDLAQDPQLLFRRFFVSLDHPRLGTLRSDRSALLLDDLKRKEWKAAPSPGEDNDYVLRRVLGFSGKRYKGTRREASSGRSKR